MLKWITQRKKTGVSTILASAIAGAFASVAAGQVVVYPTSQAAAGVTYGSIPAIPGSHILASDLFRGPGLTTQTSVNAFNAATWTGGNLTTAINQGKYFIFEIAPEANYRINITGITAGIRRSGEGPTIAGWYYADGAAITNIATTSSITSGSGVHSSFSPSFSLTNVSGLLQFALAGGGAISAEGTLRVGGPSPASNLVVNGSASLRPTGTLTWDGAFVGSSNWSSYTPDFDAAQTNWDNNDTPMNGDSIAFAGSTQLANTNDYAALTVNHVTFNSGAGAFVLGGNALSATGNYTNNSASVQTISHGVTLSSGDHDLNAAAGDMKFTSTLAGSGASVRKTGANTVEISAVATYSGNTIVSQGTLKLSGEAKIDQSPRIFIASGATLDVSAATGANYALTSGQTLGGSGTVAGKITISAGSTLSPGNSPGTINLGATAWNGGGNINWQIQNAAGVAGTGYDTVNIAGVLDLSGISSANKFNINLWSQSDLLDTNGDAINFSSATLYTWKLATAGGGITGTFDAANFDIHISANNGTGGFTNAIGGGNFSVAQNGNDIELHFDPTGSVGPLIYLKSSGEGAEQGTVTVTGGSGSYKSTVLDLAGSGTGSGYANLTGIPNPVTDEPVLVLVDLAGTGPDLDSNGRADDIDAMLEALSAGSGSYPFSIVDSGDTFNNLLAAYPNPGGWDAVFQFGLPTDPASPDSLKFSWNFAAHPTVTLDKLAVVPEPASLSMIALAGVGLATLRRGKKRMK